MSENTESTGTATAATVSMREECRRTSDGLELKCRIWAPADPVGLIVIIHGLAEHGGRYRETAEYFAGNGWAVFAGDLRGHGQSPDAPGAGRVHVNRFTDYFLDVSALIDLAREHHPQLPLFLLGHSMGGLITLSFVLQNPEGLAGAVISSPALGTHPDFQPPVLLRLLVGALDRLAPRLRFPSDLDTQAISRDPEVVRAYLEDPMVSRKVSARWYAELMRAMGRAHANAGSLTVPVLLMQSGADRLVDPEAPGRWALSAPAGQVELVEWDGLYHEMFNEPEKPEVRLRTLSWLQQQLARTPAADASQPGG